MKIKISMTRVYKDYELEIKVVQDQWLQLKMRFLLGYNMNIVILCGELTFGGEESTGADFLRGVE